MMSRIPKKVEYASFGHDGFLGQDNNDYLLEERTN